MSVGRRLVEERERLGMSQTAFFTACEVSKKAQFNFENDHNIPGGAYLIAAAALGADVLYILTGQRSQPVAPQAQLPPRVRALVENYEASDDAGRRVIEGAADLAAQSRHSKKAARGGQ